MKEKKLSSLEETCKVQHVSLLTVSLGCRGWVPQAFSNTEAPRRTPFRLWTAATCSTVEYYCTPSRVWFEEIACIEKHENGLKRKAT